MKQHSKVLIIGAGIAGSTAALVLADLGIEVTLITPEKKINSGNSELAQGGIVYTPNYNETILLKKDILTAGHYHNSISAVHFLCQKGHEIIQKFLIERINVPFDKDIHNKNFSFTREGGHHSARIIHCADHTGSSIMEHLYTAIKKSINIQILTERTAINFITTHHHTHPKKIYSHIENQCVGAYIFNEKTQEVETHLAEWTILATGGVGQLYSHTTNTQGSIGSGIAMAKNAEVILTNLEYIQFHPTALYTPNSKNKFLITESIRGEGAILINDQQQAFMEKYDQRKDLAPRDIVTHSIMKEILLHNSTCVYLDLSKITHNIQYRFPTVYQYCKNQDIDITKDHIPVIPAAHYLCGGILTDIKGRTSLKRLYSIGESSCTGVHGANRLASVSLVEALLWGYSAAQNISYSIKKKKDSLTNNIINTILDWKYVGNNKNNNADFIEQSWNSIQHTMWNYVGILRTEKQLIYALEKLQTISKDLHKFYEKTFISKAIIDLLHGCQAASTITQHALLNKKSCGCHQRI